MHSPEDSIKEGYEVTDMNTRVIVYFLCGLFALLFGAVAAILPVMRGFEQSVPAMNTEPLSALATAEMQVPSEPHLQGDPVADRIAIKGADSKQVNGYGSVSDVPGMERVHIPVELAMERMAAGKATYRQAPTTALLPAAEQ